VDFTLAGPEERWISSTYASGMQFVAGVASVVAAWAAALTLICHFGARGGQAMERKQKEMEKSEGGSGCGRVNSERKHTAEGE
jgi:hypothetical protein